jgi:hypothetical protein
MERTLFDRNGEPVAYISDDYHESIYLWDGSPVAYLFNEEHVFGINGRHLGRFINDIIYNDTGERIGFTSNTCPVAVAKESIKPKRYPMDEIRPRWSVPPLPNLSFTFASQDLTDFLKEGQVARFREEISSAEDTSEESPE